MPHVSPESKPTARRVLNLKAVAIIVGAGTLLSILTGWLHSSQLVRTSNYLKAAAEQAMADEDPHRAFDLLEQYLVLKPNDRQAEEQISQLLEEHGTSTQALLRAFHINEKQLLDDKSRDDLRLRQIRISDRLGRYSDAAVHLKTLRDKRSDLSEIWHFSGIVARDTGNFSDALEYFSKAVELENPVPESFQYLAQLLTSEASDIATAENVLNTMVNRFHTAATHQIRADWLIAQQRPQEAIQDLWAALRSEGLNVRSNAMLLKSIRMAAAEDHQFDGDAQYRLLIDHLNRMLAEHPDEPKLRLYLSSALWATDQRQPAIDNLDYGLERDPRQFELSEALVDYLVSDRQYDRAQQVFDRIPQRVIDRGRREFIRGRLLMSQKQWGEAIQAFEMALGFAHDDASVASRVRVCLALCRRESGDNVAAMDAYRALVQTNPDFEGGRLGMASAYLRSDQIPLAIAEYRQLLHVDGVPEFLANLMIRYNLSLSPRSRNWSEVEQLLRDVNPLVRDVVQRTLLQADLLFAEGLPAKAMDHLDRAAQQMPDREEIQRAYERLSSIHGDNLNQRVLRVLKEEPASMEAHISVLRLQLSRQDTEDMTAWLNKLLNGSVLEGLDDTERLQIIATAGTQVAESEIATRGSTEQTSVLLKYAGEARRRLASTSSRYLLDYVRFLGRHNSVDSAIAVTAGRASNMSVYQQSQCWLECLRAAPDSAVVAERVTTELTALINAEPSATAPRLAFADSRMLLEQYDYAYQTLSEMADADNASGATLARLAWLQIIIKGNRQQGLELSQQASLKSPTDPYVRSIRGLALGESGQLAQGLEVLTLIPQEQRSEASRLFEARLLTLADRGSEAGEIVRKLVLQTQDLMPAERSLLSFLKQQLQLDQQNMTSR